MNQLKNKVFNYILHYTCNDWNLNIFLLHTHVYLISMNFHLYMKSLNKWNEIISRKITTKITKKLNNHWIYFILKTKIK